MDFRNGNELLALCKQEDCLISQVMRRREWELGEMAPDRVEARMARALEIMRESATQPLKHPVRSMGGLIGGEAKRLAAHAAKKKSLCGPVLQRAITYAMGVLEVNASMGCIVAAPTAGASGILAGVLIECGHERGWSDDQLVDALFTAGAVGLLFAKNAGRIVTRDMIRDALWDDAGAYVEENTLSVYIKRLREKIEDDPANPRIILTVRGTGYRLGGSHVSE